MHTHSLAHATDGQLLYRYARLGEQEAFSMLMQRHGTLVWGVCRRLLIHHQDAEDAFQATFVVLARKAASLRQPDQLAAWLHGVAQRTAWQISRHNRRLLPREPLLDIAVAEDQRTAWQECRQVIDQAVARLPASLRIVFLLAQYEELTTLSIARKLGVPEGTVVSRLHRARKLLQGWLSRRGITSAAGAVSVFWGLSLPETLTAASLKSILTATPPILVAGLAQGVLTTMFWTKLTTVTAVAVSLGLAATGTVALLAQSSVDKNAAASNVKQQQPPRQDRLKQLEAQLHEARDCEEMLRKELAAMKYRVDETQTRLEVQMQKERKLQEFLNNKLLLQEKERQTEHEKNNLFDKEQEKRKATRLKDYAEARELLANEISGLRKRIMDYDQLRLEAVSQQQAIELANEKSKMLQQSIQNAKEQLGSKHEKVQLLHAEYDKLRADMQELSKQKIRMPEEGERAFLHSQLKLREKLLLEVDEKLLRSKLKLD